MKKLSDNPVTAIYQLQGECEAQERLLKAILGTLTHSHLEAVRVRWTHDDPTEKIEFGLAQQSAREAFARWEAVFEALGLHSPGQETHVDDSRPS